MESLAFKCLNIGQQKTNTIRNKSKIKYEDLTFIKDDCNKCRDIILKILSMIPEVWNKIETDSLIQVIVDSNEGVLQEEETKENLTSSIPDHIYGKEYQLVHILTQSLVQFKELENKIGLMLNLAYQNNLFSLSIKMNMSRRRPFTDYGQCKDEFNKKNIVMEFIIYRNTLCHIPPLSCSPYKIKILKFFLAVVMFPSGFLTTGSRLLKDEWGFCFGIFSSSI